MVCTSTWPQGSICHYGGCRSVVLRCSESLPIWDDEKWCFRTVDIYMQWIIYRLEHLDISTLLKWCMLGTSLGVRHLRSGSNKWPPPWSHRRSKMDGLGTKRTVSGSMLVFPRWSCWKYLNAFHPYFTVVKRVFMHSHLAGGNGHLQSLLA